MAKNAPVPSRPVPTRPDPIGSHVLYHDPCQPSDAVDKDTGSPQEPIREKPDPTPEPYPTPEPSSSNGVGLAYGDLIRQGAAEGWDRPRTDDLRDRIAVICPVEAAEFRRIADMTRRRAVKPGWGYFVSVLESERARQQREDELEPDFSDFAADG